VRTHALVIAALLAAPLTAHAQPVNLGALDDRVNVATVTTGHEYGLVVGAGYARAVTVAARRLVLGGDLTLGAAELDPGDYRVRAGALAPLLGRGRWKLAASVDAIVRGTGNDLGRMTDVGGDAALLAGFYARRGFAAAELGVDYAMATYIHHSDAYRMDFPGARDRWLGNAGVIPHAGIQAGLTIGRVDAILRVGRLGGDVMFPIYGTLTVDTRF